MASLLPHCFSHSCHQVRLLGMDVTDDRCRLIAIPEPWFCQTLNPAVPKPNCPQTQLSLLPFILPLWGFRRRQWHPTPVLLPWKSHGQRSLVGCSPWGRQELGMTERLHFHISLSCIGEGNGNPLHCSCLENPRDSGAWWAAVYGVAQSRTRLKQLSMGF